MRETGRFDVFHVPYRRERWAIVDLDGVPEGQEAPEENIIRLRDEQVVILLRAVAKTELINQVLAERVYDKDIANRHLDIIEKLVDQGSKVRRK